MGLKGRIDDSIAINKMYLFPSLTHQRSARCVPDMPAELSLWFDRVCHNSTSLWRTTTAQGPFPPVQMQTGWATTTLLRLKVGLLFHSQNQILTVTPQSKVNNHLESSLWYPKLVNTFDQFGSKTTKELFIFLWLRIFTSLFISEKYKQGLKVTSWLDMVYLNLDPAYRGDAVLPILHIHAHLISWKMWALTLLLEKKSFSRFEPCVLKNLNLRLSQSVQEKLQTQLQATTFEIFWKGSHLSKVSENIKKINIKLSWSYFNSTNSLTFSSFDVWQANISIGLMIPIHRF